jgi:predicted RNase H-like nuclease
LSSPRHLGLDLAWSERNPSGLAALEADGTLACVRADLRSDAEILRWVRRWLGGSGVVAIDMPTIVPNAAGARPCERELQQRFRRQHAGPYPANRGLGPFADGGRAARMIAALAADGLVENPADFRPGDPRNVAIEVFPHAAHVVFFARERIFKYKRKPAHRDYLAEWGRYRAALATLARADPPLVLDARIPLELTSARGYKAWDDTLDALTCAYVGAFVHRWGLQPPHVEVVGDLAGGYIVVPLRVV